MLLILSDAEWLCFQGLDLGDDFIQTFQFVDVQKSGYKYWTYWPVAYFPSPSFEVRKDFTLDRKEDRVETYENILDDSLQSFEYEGHTWNNFFHQKVGGQITNLPPNFPRRFMPHGIINQRTGTDEILPDFYDFRDSWFHYHHGYQYSTWNPSVDKHELLCRYWNPKTGRVRVASWTWYTREVDDELILCNSAGNKLQPGYYTAGFIKAQYLMRETGSGQEYEFRKEGFSLWIPDVGFSQSLWIDPNTTGQTAYAQFCSLCRVTDSKLSPPQNPTWRMVRKQKLAWVSMGRALPEKLRQPNWEALFPQKQHSVYWPEIAAEAYQDLGMTSINGIANVKELFEMGEAVSGFYKTLKSLPSKRAAAAAQAYLAVHYGFKLTVLDAIELRKTLKQYSEKRSSLSKCQASKSWTVGPISYRAGYQVFYDEFAKLKSTLQELLLISDFALSSENWWDMVPYSFVVDWFIGVGDVLQALDNFYNLTQRHEVICAGKSILEERILSKSALGLADNLVTSPMVASRYYRMYQKKLVTPSLVPSVTINPFNHLIEAAALVISRK